MSLTLTLVTLSKQEAALGVYIYLSKCFSVIFYLSLKTVGDFSLAFLLCDFNS